MRNVHKRGNFLIKKIPCIRNKNDDIKILLNKDNIYIPLETLNSSRKLTTSRNNICSTTDSITTTKVRNTLITKMLLPKI